jgi:hypothetical protein
MEKKYQKLYIWSFIIVSGIILMLLYTPLGGNLHKSTYAYQEYNNTSVNFGGRIANAPKRGKYNQSSNNDAININRSGYSVLSKPIVSPSGSSSSFNSTANYQPSNKSELSNTGGSGAPGNGMMALGSKGGSGNSGSGSVGGVGGGLFSSGNSSNSSGGVMQKGTQAGFTPADPGGSDDEEEDLGGPLPVGNGLYFLLFMALIYGLFKFKNQ